jgi:hypothetical protein
VRALGWHVVAPQAHGGPGAPVGRFRPYPGRCYELDGDLPHGGASVEGRAAVDLARQRSPHRSSRQTGHAPAPGSSPESAAAGFLDTAREAFTYGLQITAAAGMLVGGPSW